MTPKPGLELIVTAAMLLTVGCSGESLERIVLAAESGIDSATQTSPDSGVAADGADSSNAADSLETTDAHVDADAHNPNDVAIDPLDAPEDADLIDGDAARTWWPQPQDGPSYGSTTGDDRGNCTFLCTKGNYNQAFKRDLCNAGKTPGVGPIFYNGHYQFWGLMWDEMGTSQDHQGVCVTTHVADVGGTGIAATRRIFHDGCTGYPNGTPRKMTKGPNAGWTPENWGQAFHGACVVHDLCYKAEPSFSGKPKEYCDDQMAVHAKVICNASYDTTGGNLLQKNDLDQCLAAADSARFWLQAGAASLYTAYNYTTRGITLRFSWPMIPRCDVAGAC
jgi:hypothetical protein